ncbi:TetR/AcrR family transcriptional regulator [Glycomyces dulcitolivorans]|uniref:TetR/AcrR family transcriptional regulator n=1 Tax=Glycomyces dulcitolivorans TaxID=2200759 RepID=UPI000DD43688|nr:TetR/AcrR family transcriptional regulator [Glycomyces dulcitolivorans]
MSQLVEHRSRKAARVLESTRELVLDHGIRKLTVAEIAKAAGVGKGTVYLYWPSKEDLIVGLFAREALTLLEALVARLDADPASVLPSRLAPLLVSTGRRITLANRLTAGDFDLLRQLVRQSGARELFADVMPAALCEAVMPVLHRHGLLRNDRPLADQAFAMHAMLTGFGDAVLEPDAAPRPAGEPEAILADAVARLLEPATAPDDAALAAAATEVAAAVNRTRDAVLDLIGRTQVPGA